jgi:curved DNA-binding protein CbpA
VSASLARLYLPSDATAEDAKHAYRGLVRLLHPDRVGAQSEELAAVIAAYRYLEESGWLAEHAQEHVRHSGELLDVRA